MRMTVLVLLYEGVSGFEATGAFAALRAAGHAPAFVAREALVPTREGFRLVPHRLGHDTIPGATALVIPGGDAASALRDADLMRTLRARRGAHVLASGEGIRIAHGADLTTGRRVAQPPGAPLDGTENRPARLVEDGRLLTSAGGDAIVDLALHLVARLDGAEAAKLAAHALGREHRPFVMGAAHGDA